MYCLECSTENSEDNKYCKECGVPLQIASVTSALPALPSATEKQHQLQRLLDLAFWHTQSGNTDAAITSCRAALSLKPDSTTALSLLGCLYEKKGRDEEAIEAFEQVVSLNPYSVADAQKLELLRQGVRIKAVPQPLVYRWMPLGLAQLVHSHPSSPFIGAATAFGVVLVAGAWLTFAPMMGRSGHTLAAGSTLQPTPTPEQVAASNSTSRGAPYRQTASQAQNTGSISVTTTPAQASDIPTASTDPFLANLNSQAAYAGSPRQPRQRMSLASGPPITTPPLAVNSLPSLDGVHPLETSTSASNQSSPTAPSTPSVQLGTVPEHTVYVEPQNMNSSPTARAASSLSQDDSSDDGSPAPASHIRITVHNGTFDNGSTPIPNDDGVPVHTVTIGPDNGVTLQQQALTYQQQGNYVKAGKAYEAAITAYEQDVASGRDTDTAKRGIESCKTGLQICQQSQ